MMLRKRIRLRIWNTVLSASEHLHVDLDRCLGPAVLEFRDEAVKRSAGYVGTAEADVARAPTQRVKNESENPRSRRHDGGTHHRRLAAEPCRN